MFTYQNVTAEVPKTTVSSSTLGGFYDDPLSQYGPVRDLRAIADDRRILRNPHKGWYWHYIDNGYKRDNYRVLHDPDDHLLDFPGLHHLYLRFDWGDVEREEGVYDWSYIDEIMEKWGALGYRFSLRICTYEGSGEIPFATPEFVYKAGARGYALSGGRLEPDYGDPIFLEKLARFMEEAGRKFHGDRRIELIDVGTFGTWGEGHTGAGSEIVYPSEILRKHIDLHVRNFPDTFIMLNDDHINSRSPAGIADNRGLLEYAKALGLGLDDDSVCVRYYAENCGYNTLRTPFLFDHFWREAPTVLEFEHYTGVAPEVFKNGYPFIDAMIRAHATFAGFHGYPRPWLEREPYLSEYAANRLGYWYFIPAVEAGESLALDAPNILRLHVENRGFSKAYYKYTLKIRIEDTHGGVYEQLADTDNRCWMPGESSAVTVRLRPCGLCAGAAAVSVGLFEEDRVIELGIRKEREKDGFYHLFDTVLRTL